MIALYLLVVLAWTWVCLTAGRIYEAKRIERDDLNARDEWAKRYEQWEGVQ